MTTREAIDELINVVCLLSETRDELRKVRQELNGMTLVAQRQAAAGRHQDLEIARLKRQRIEDVETIRLLRSQVGRSTERAA